MNRLFLLIAVFLSSFVCAQNISTVAEIYDFEVGDIFHFQDQFNAQPPYVIRMEILNKYYSPPHDTLYYVRNMNSFSMPWFPNDSIQYTNVIDTFAFTNLDSLIMLSADSVYTDPAEFNGRIINYSEICDLSSPDILCITNKYVEGCGLVYYDYNYPLNNYEIRHYLVYYKKGNETWGTPITTGMDDVKSTDPKFRIYPNPSHDYLTVQSDDNQTKNYKIRIIDLQARILKSLEIPSPLHQKIDISSLDRGLYFIEITNGLTKKAELFIKY